VVVLVIGGMRLLACGERTASFRHQIGRLVHEAGNPYYDWLFGGADHAHEFLAAASVTTSSELWEGRARLCVTGQTLLGMYVALEGQDVAECRMADTLTLLRQLNRRSVDVQEELRERVAESRRLFAPVSNTDYFLSKIAVVAEFRGQGIAGVLLDAFLEEGTAMNYERFRLDVSADNKPAVALYESRGFRTVEERQLHDMTYLQMMRT
jgi:GNAT superfamily N-acetyltransferase